MARVDAAIVGGGVAGLMALWRLREAGFQALLVDIAPLGSGQTIAAQGIIHSGLKYRGDDRLRAQLAAMPARWKNLLPRLGAAIRSEQTYFWFPPSRLPLAGYVAAAIARRKLAGATTKLARADWPSPFGDAVAAASVLSVDEPVVDVPSLLRALAEPHRDAIRRVDRIETDGEALVVSLHGKASVRIEAGLRIYAAGRGNEEIAARFGVHQQVRPLRQVMVRGAPRALYGHALRYRSKDNIRATFTTHESNGELIWYVGGDLAEQGAAMTPDALISASRRELAAIAPGDWLKQARFASVAVERAEMHEPGKVRPESYSLARRNGELLAWPTKLTLAPALADAILGHAATVAKREAETDVLADWPFPGYASPPWENATWS